MRREFDFQRANRASSPETFTGSVVLRKKKSKNVYDLEEVRLTPHPPLQIGTAQEAKHYAATYALFRPPPLLIKHGSTTLIPSLRRKKSRLGKRNERRKKELRRMKKMLTQRMAQVAQGMMQRFPTAVLEATRDISSNPSDLLSGSATPSLDLPNIESQLTTLGFRPAHITSALTALSAANARLYSSSSSSTDPLVLSLSILSPLEAAIEWLLLHLPEDDLPPRYRTTSSAGDLVTGVSVGGKEQLVKGWLIDKLTKGAGFPRKAVEEVIRNVEATSSALDILGRRLCGWDGDWAPEAYEPWDGHETEGESRRSAREEEMLTLEAVLGERFTILSSTECTVDIEYERDNLTLHLLFDDASPFPSPTHPTYPPAFYLSSDTVPSYMRLHLHSQLLRQFRDPERHDFTSVLEAGAGGAVLLMVEHIETLLPDVLANPPDLGEVTRFLVPRLEEISPAIPKSDGPGRSKPEIRRHRHQATSADEASVQKRHQAMSQDPAYKKILDDRQKLPAWKERHNITSALDSNRVILVVGETGCGKTTQLPQFILDHEISQNRGSKTNIIVTQPRRVAAMGVAQRVAYERLEDLDKATGTVGYAIRGERRASSDTRLLFCTTGVVLRRLGTDKDLGGVSHVIVDEAHERGVDTDLLICLLKEILERNKTLKVVIMSATINERIFIDYFNGCPSLSIPGFTYPVKDHYLENVIPLLPNLQPTQQRFGSKQTEEQKISIRADFEKLSLDPISQRTLEILSQSDRIDYNLISAVVTHIISISEEGAILIFLPGVMEIRQCISNLSSASIGQVEILPLHANLTSTEQRRVFLSTGRKRKIVVSTNVAETSVTIPDVVFVIDTGRVKETDYDVMTGMQKLEEGWTSRASGRQRRGRAGRTREGECFKLYTKRTEEKKMMKFSKPEMLRVPLEMVLLQVKAMDENIDVEAFLLKAIDPPKLHAISTAWTTLIDLGIVLSSSPSSPLTALGKHISSIPVDLRLAKMLVLAVIFKVLDPILTITALLSSKPLFISPLDNRDTARTAREKFSTGRSDLLTDVKAYSAAMELSGMEQRKFCEENFISSSTVRDVRSLREDFIGALQGIGFLGRKGEIEKFSQNGKLEGLVKGVVVGGLYPRIARINMPKATYERVQQGAVLKDHEAKEVKLFDPSGRVFLHPSSILFTESGFKPGFIAYFSKAETSKVFLRDATEVPLYSLLLFGGPLTINHFAGGVLIGKEGHIKLRAQPRVGALCSQLRRLLDAQLAETVESPDGVEGLSSKDGEGVVNAMMALLTRDGLSQ
ncbi:hypothetical protein TREMEDRAFT_45797 [Tremella mesenterica DSM 1558]|uniref:uncharacterized protein n=1 Tax=Tremella mesenterica (strain ATCC 24925 / CBS 8224 / DSM 1558 / NBRC 9311 / NRRL Y-6157 / RJB 2259-6 / UBC 559-6) TaxID=578456 RepID=UPI00032D4BCA|nr:uncharacterized protein TREMEDRAFT_45797 [Tremella mesenterica DSM 1558]EIW66325.1 hypothetical protein TREMEDRAFT_45797 [Tremella mesenterica DSM 1558]